MECQRVPAKKLGDEKHLELKQNIGPVEEISTEEVKKAITKMTEDKASGPSSVPIEAIWLSNIECALAKIRNDMMYGMKYLRVGERVH